MQFNHNPYYSPQLCGLEIFTSVETGSGYNFDTFVVWKKLDDNTLWYAMDSGCSCPTPFADADLDQITKDTFFNFNNDLKHHNRISQEEVNDISIKVKNYLKIK